MPEIKLPHEHNKNTAHYLDHMPEPEAFAQASDVFSLLGDSTRVRLFWILCHCEECVMNLSAMMDMSSPAISHHLKLLKATGLITNRREGKEMFYKAANTELADELHHIIEKVVMITCPSSESNLEK